MNFKNSIVFFIIFIIALFIFLNNSDNNKNNNRIFEFNYSAVFKKTDGKKFEAWIPYPQSNETQHISNILISLDLEYEILNELKHGNKYIYIYNLEGLNQDVEFDMSFIVDRKEHSTISYNDIEESEYLKASNQVPVGSIFSNIISENNLNSNNMRNVYDFVLDGMHYGKPTSKDNKYFNEPWLSDNELYGMKKVTRSDVLSYYKQADSLGSTYTFGNGSSLYACDIGVGNCTDYHSYFISLSRSMDIPARFHMGFPISDQEEGVVGGYHCWADYYIDGEGWSPVDISEADKNLNKEDYFFGNVCNNRVEFMVGRDFELKNYNGIDVNILIYPIVEVDDVESDNFTKSFYFKNL